MKIITELNDRQIRRLVKRAADLYEEALNLAAHAGCGGEGVSCPHCECINKARQIVQSIYGTKRSKK